MFIAERTPPPGVPCLEAAVVRPPSSEPPKISRDDLNDTEVYIHMLDSQFPYGNEFYGSDVSLALTPMTERCFLTLTQVIIIHVSLCLVFSTVIYSFIHSFIHSFTHHSLKV